MSDTGPASQHPDPTVSNTVGASCSGWVAHLLPRSAIDSLATAFLVSLEVRGLRPARLLPARREWDLAVELRRHAVIAAGLLARGVLFGGARVILSGAEEGQRAVILCQMDLGAVAVGTGLFLPLAGAQRAFDEHLRPFARNFSATSPRPSLKIATRCHSARRLRSPLLRSFQLSLVAMLSVTTGAV